MIRTACSLIGRMLHVRMLSFLHFCCNLHCSCCCYNKYAVVIVGVPAIATFSLTMMLYDSIPHKQGARIHGCMYV